MLVSVCRITKCSGKDCDNCIAPTSACPKNMTPRIVDNGKIISFARCSCHAFRSTTSINIDARPTKDICATFSHPNGADGTQMGQPAQNAHADVSVTLRPARVRARTTKNNARTYREKEERRENFMLDWIPVFG